MSTSAEDVSSVFALVVSGLVFAYVVVSSVVRAAFSEEGSPPPLHLIVPKRVAKSSTSIGISYLCIMCFLSLDIYKGVRI